MEENIFKNQASPPKAALVGIDEGGGEDTEALLDELERLLDTAGGVTAARVVQNRSTPDPRTYIGSGKVRELGDICKINGITLAVFDAELSPSQIKNLEDDLGDDIMVIDRSMLILDIFALHASSAEGKLQVELAQLKYTAPRLIGKGLQLSRQQGGNIAMRGPGETKLETDRRHLARRTAALEEQLRELEKNRAVARARRERSPLCQVAIAGYTNAGKSTLLNRLTDAGILAEDKLFATLDPTTRRYRLPGGGEILLTDTVGFIRNLPHHLIKAFRSTLDEVRYADIIIVVIDASDKNYLKQTEVTRSLLGELGAAEKPVLYVFNKCDLPSADIPRIPELPPQDTLYISAATGEGVEALAARLEQLAAEGREEITLHIPNSEQGALNSVYKNASVTEVAYGDDFITVKAVADKRARGMFLRYINPPERD